MKDMFVATDYMRSVILSVSLVGLQQVLNGLQFSLSFLPALASVKLDLGPDRM